MERKEGKRKKEKEGFLVFVCSLEFLETLEKKVYSLTDDSAGRDCKCKVGIFFYVASFHWVFDGNTIILHY